MSQTASANQNLCDYCHQKPKFGTHQYCGRTCSAQAAASVQQQQPQQAALCKQCQKRPTFQNFDFCGKHCASTWQTSHPASSKPGKGPVKQAVNTQPPPAPQPLQPQSQNQVANQPAVAAPVVASVQPPVGPKVAVPPAGLNIANPPAIASVPPQQQQQQQPVLNVTAQVPAPNSNVAPVPPTSSVCLIANCGKPVYTAPGSGSSYPSEYCSTRHREEAVTSGFAKACILCNKFPRSNTDHFCSKLCRDTALAP